jgi:sulfatase modifying factor 1
MIRVSAGEFLMGSPASEKGRENDETQHRVRLTQPFWLGKYEVTQGQWKVVMGTDPSKFKGDDLPVEQVSWEDAMAFCRKLNQMDGNRPSGYVYSLPTEAQWEYACRAGKTTATAFGDSLSSREANFNGEKPYGGAAKEPKLGKTAPVGSYRPNAWGFYDLHGNVREWCSDWYGDYPSGSVTNPAGPSFGTHRVDRGGSWFSYGGRCRSASRDWLTPGVRDFTLCFRPSLRSE